MPTNRRFPSSISALRRILTPRPPHPYFFSIQSILQPATLPTPGSVRARFKSDDSRNNAPKGGKFQEWSGASTKDHTINRAKAGDVTDPNVEGSVTGQRERVENAGIADESKSGATTERDLRRSNKRAKEEHPKAPEPIIGMNDEKGQKGH